MRSKSCIAILPEVFNYIGWRKKKVNKGAWRMPWLLEAKKDVISCDKLGGEANTHYIPRFPNGTTQYVEDILSIDKMRSKPAELKHLSRRRRRK